MGNGATSLVKLTRMAAALFTLAALLGTAGAATTVADDTYPLLFPVAGENSYTDTWGAPRSEGRSHKGADIFAEKGTPVVAAASGRIIKVAVGERAGRYIVIEHDDGWKSYYMHLNNDTPGTDDGLGGAPVAGIHVGAQVTAGDVLDYVGDSGNAEGTSSHLHFELHRPDGTAVNPTPALRAAQYGPSLEVQTFASAPTAAYAAYEATGTTFVGHVDPGGGFAAGIALNGDTAFLGTWGRPEACPASGVRIIDVSDPAAPVVLGSVADGEEFPDTSADGVWAGSVENDFFTGDLLVTSVRLCDTSERSRRGDSFRGLAIYDVTTPADPALLGTLHSGEYTQGANNVTGAVNAEGQLLLSVAVMQSFIHTDGVTGDWRLIDATDPTSPAPLADWDYRERFPVDSAQPDPREDVNLHVHDSWLAADGSAAWVSAWDGGVVMLDLEDPAAPVEAAHIPTPTGGAGNAHSVAYDPETGLLIRNDEDLEWRPDDESDLPTWGAQTLFDASDLSSVVPVGSYRAPNTDFEDGKPVAPGYFSAHEVMLYGDIEYVSWYSDGLRIVDVSDPSAPIEVGSFVPPPTADPQRHFLGQGRGSDFAMVWSVKVHEGLIFLSDMNTGLWIVQLGNGAEAMAASDAL